MRYWITVVWVWCDACSVTRLTRYGLQYLRSEFLIFPTEDVSNSCGLGFHGGWRASKERNTVRLACHTVVHRAARELDMSYISQLAYLVCRSNLLNMQGKV